MKIIHQGKVLKRVWRIFRHFFGRYYYPNTQALWLLQYSSIIYIAIQTLSPEFSNDI